MFAVTKNHFASLLLAVFVVLGAGSGAIAQDQDAQWRVSKSSGDVWVTTEGAQPVSLSADAVLKSGDKIRTGQNGRVLLVRGPESMLISPNTIVGIPTAAKEGLSTTILQQAGSILLDVEKRNVQHFEVETPYLAAVVKGTQFRVTVNPLGSNVEVLRGQVQVTDFKTGQHALVNKDQIARVSLQGPSGLSLSGLGALNPVQQGTPRNTTINPIIVPRDGFTAPAGTQPQRTQMPAPQRQVQWAPSKDTSTDSWSGDLVNWGKGLFGMTNGRKTRDDNITLLLAIPGVVGFSVAVGAAVMRRRNKDKQKPDGR